MYQDGNGHELYPNVIVSELSCVVCSLNLGMLLFWQDYDGENLLSITGRDPADYARKVLRKLFTADELASSVLPSRFDHLYTKKPLDKDRFDILNSKLLFANQQIYNELVVGDNKTPLPNCEVLRFQSFYRSSSY